MFGKKLVTRLNQSKKILSEMKMSRIRIQNDIGDLLDRIKNLEIRVRKMNNEEVDEE